MPLPSIGRILVCASQTSLVQELRGLLEVHGYVVDEYLLGTPLIEALFTSRLIIIDGSGQSETAIELCAQLRPRLEEPFVPLLFLTNDNDSAVRWACLEAGADAFLSRPFVAGELIAQMNALLRIKDSHDRLFEKSTEVHRINKRLQQAYQQIDQELELAQRIQFSFLPQSLPQVPHVRFAVHYLLCGRVGGDFYDIFRLDEQHVGFYVADAMGHGVPASLLTIYVKKGVKTKEVFGSQYRLIPPDEVLYRLNRDLIEQELSEHPFITMVYALFNHKDGTLQFARAGHPYPLYLPREGEPQLWKQDGLLLGIVDAKFPNATYHLKLGDKMLFYTDGIDNARFEDYPEGLDSLIACANRHRDLSVQDLVAILSRELFANGEPTDDLTLLGLERCD